MAQELKAYNVVATADVNPEVVESLGCTEWAAYDADEVDAVLAENDAEIEGLKSENNRRNLVIFVLLLLIGIAGIIVSCEVPMPHVLGATVGIVSGVLCIVGGVGLCKVIDNHDDDGPFFYGPGGTVI